MKLTDIPKTLRDHRLKVTPQRLKIVESLNTFGHLNIDMLYEEVKSAYPNVSLATVYKNIAIMTENGMLNEVKIPDIKTVFEVSKQPHHHLYCRRCGKVEDIEIDCGGIHLEAETKSGYRIEATETVFIGICGDCRNDG